LRSGRNAVEYEFLPGHRRRAVWLDPDLPATFELMEQVLAGLAVIFPGPYLHIGADEPRGMPDEAYASYVRRLRRLVRSLGKQPRGWQESARAGLGPDDLAQLWLTGIGRPASAPPQGRAPVEAAAARPPGGAPRLAGVEAALWAETLSGFDDLSFPLLPRLAGVAHRAWSAPQPAKGQPAEGQPAEGQPAEGQPAEGQPAEGQPAEGQ